MTYTIGKLGPRHFFEPGFDMSIYFYLRARILSTQQPPYDAHILQGLIRYVDNNVKSVTSKINN